MTLKTEYLHLKEQYDKVKRDIAELTGRKGVAEEEIKKLNEQLSKLTKGKDVNEVLELLDKEIETRVELIRSKLDEYDRAINQHMSSDVGFTDENILDSLEGDLDDI